jgi:hypothetical protein
MITSAAAIGQVGLEWKVAGFGPMNGAGTSDMVLRNVNTGAFEVYDISHNQLTGAASLGQVGNEFQLGGFAVDPPTASMGNSGAQLAAADSSSQLAGAMADPPADGTSSASAQLAVAGSSSQHAVPVDSTSQLAGAMAGFDSGTISHAGPSGGSPAPQITQLVQAMAGFGGDSGTADSSHTVLISGDTSHQPFLTTPQHA